MEVKNPVQVDKNSVESSSSSSEYEESCERMNTTRSVLIKKFRNAVFKVIKMNKAKRHKKGNCFTNYFFCQFNSLFKKLEIREKDLWPLPEPVTGKMIMQKFDGIYRKEYRKIYKDTKMPAKNFFHGVSPTFVNII